MCKNNHKNNHFVPIPPLEEGDVLRSMSVVPYLDDLHTPCLDEEETEQHSQYDESFSAGRSSICSFIRGLINIIALDRKSVV